MAGDLKRFFICGSALRGQPDHQNLQGSTFVCTANTRPNYRLHAIKDGWHPGIYEVSEGGISIPGEIYEMSSAQYEYLLANEPPDMYESPIQLDTGESVSAMLYPQELSQQWPDISNHGGWAAYKATLAAQKD